MNKEQLEQLSDLEINKLIADIEQIELELDESGTFYWDECWVYDPCNSSSGMMPLVFESGISLTDPDSSGGKVWIASKWFASLRPSIQSRSGNPLRAAAIVYLLMKEGK